MSFPVRVPLAIAAVAALAACGAEPSPRAKPGITGQFVATSAAPAVKVASPAEYRLETARVGDWVNAQRNVAIAIFSKPGLRAASAEDGSVDERTARLDAAPELVAAIAEAGLTPREYATIGWVIARAQSADAAGIQPDNVAFMRTHGPEVARLVKAMNDEINEGEVFPGSPSEEIADEN